MTDPRKAIFDAARAAKGAGFTQEQVDALNYALDRAGVPREFLTLGAKGEALIKRWESYKQDLGDGRVQAYPDPATGGAPWTIGWGTTGPDVAKGTIWTREKAQERFRQHVAEFSAGVAQALESAPTTQDQFDALVSWTYNVGITAMQSSTLIKRHKAGDYDGAANEFLRWNKAAGKVLNGLTNRRKDERSLYLGLT